MEESCPVYNSKSSSFGVQEDFPAEYLSLDQLFSLEKPSRYLFKMEGDAMAPTISPGSFLIVDRSLKITSGDLGLFFYEGAFLCKRYKKKAGLIYLDSDNQLYPSLPIATDSPTELWGVVVGGVWKA